MADIGLVEGREKQAGFIGQVERLNAILEEVHNRAAKIVGPDVTNEVVADEIAGYAGRLESGLERALLSAQGLSEQLLTILEKF